MQGIHRRSVLRAHGLQPQGVGRAFKAIVWQAVFSCMSSLQDAWVAFGAFVRSAVRGCFFGLQFIRRGSMTLDGHGGCLSCLRYSMGACRGAPPHMLLAGSFSGCINDPLNQILRFLFKCLNDSKSSILCFLVLSMTLIAGTPKSYEKLRLSYVWVTKSYEKLQKVTFELRKSYEKLQKVTNSYKRVTE